jgi:hypothetical protein
MKWLPRDKRNPFFAVVFVIALILILICFVLIRSQYDSLTQIATSKKLTANRLQNVENIIKNGSATANQLADATYALSRAEEDMASGDLYSWTYDTIRRLIPEYKIDIPQIGHPAVSDVDLLSNVPYKQMRFTVSGTAYYHDFGRFVADFENNFPHARIVNVVLEPSGAGGEKLAFTMDIIVLIKPNQA